MPYSDNKRLGRRRRLMASGIGALAGFWGKPSASLAGVTPLYVKGKKSPGLDQLKLSDTPDPHVRALRRLSFGYRPEDLSAMMAMGADLDERLTNWVDAQLAGFEGGLPTGNDPELAALVNDPEVGFETVTDSLQTLWQEYRVAAPEWPHWMMPTIETQYLAFLRATHSRWQLGEVLADFWHTHFSVHGAKFEVAPTFVHYDRDVIRPNMLGNFRQMLEAVTQSTAMMYYLDNVFNSVFGPNENFAREIQELHTLGAINSYGFTREQDIPEAVPIAGSGAVLPAGLKAGYSERDVVSVTQCLTGWTISNPYNDGLNTGEYIYYPDWHDNSAKRVLGIDITETGEDEAHRVLDLLAVHPNTARYVCRKLCARLIGDDPPESIVEEAARVFNDQWQASDQLAQVVRRVILSDEFKSASTWGAKVKRPFEIMAGVLRSCGGFTEKLIRADLTLGWPEVLQLGRANSMSVNFYWETSNTGQVPFTWVTPDGFPDRQEAWLGGTPLVMSWRALNTFFIQWFPVDLNDINGAWYDYRPVDAVALTQAMLPPAQHTPSGLVDFWVHRILGYDASQPSTPQLNSQVRDRLVAFMQQNAPGPDQVLDISNDGGGPSVWEEYVTQRLQTLVALIGMLPDNLLR